MRSNSLRHVALLCVVLATLIVGCHRDRTQRLIDREILAIYDCPKDEFRIESARYDISPAVKVLFDQKESQYYLHYSITVDHPGEYMKDVRVTGLLNEKMMGFLNAPFLFLTSVSSDTPINIGGEGSPGLVVGSGFILKPRSEINQSHFREVFQEVWARVTWVNKIGKRESEYFHWTTVKVDDSVWEHMKQ